MSQSRITVVKLKIRRIGNSLGVTLPAETIKALRVSEGDAVYLTETPEGYQLVAHDPEFATAMETADGFMKRYRNALRELAK
jgi:putative addiction module antidote